MISGCQRYIVEVRDVGTFIRDARDARDARTRVRILYSRYAFKLIMNAIEEYAGVKFVDMLIASNSI